MTREEAENTYYRSLGSTPEHVKELDRLIDYHPRGAGPKLLKRRRDAERAIRELMEYPPGTTLDDL